jgi:hypothetical protein
MPSFPTVDFVQFDLSSDPSGTRDSGGTVLGTTATNYLDFGNANTSTTSGAISQTNAMVLRVSDMAQASGVYNMRFYVSSATAFSEGSFRFLHSFKQHWQGADYALTLSDDDLSTTEPLQQNLVATNGQPVLSGITDDDVSQYIYTAVYVDGDVPYGTYGGGGAGTFRYRVYYDFS